MSLFYSLYLRISLKRLQVLVCFQATYFILSHCSDLVKRFFYFFLKVFYFFPSFSTPLFATAFIFYHVYHVLSTIFLVFCFFNCFHVKHLYFLFTVPNALHHIHQILSTNFLMIIIFIFCVTIYRRLIFLQKFCNRIHINPNLVITFFLRFIKH